MGLPHPNKHIAAGRPLKWFLQITTEVFLLCALLQFGTWPLHIWNVIFTGYIYLFFPRPIKDFPLQVRIAFTISCFTGSFAARSILWFLFFTTLGSIVLNYDLFVRLLSLLPQNRYEPLTFNLVRETITTAPKDGRFSAGKRPIHLVVSVLASFEVSRNSCKIPKKWLLTCYVICFCTIYSINICMTPGVGFKGGRVSRGLWNPLTWWVRD
eukprot:EG_transcript_29861